MQFFSPKVARLLIALLLGAMVPTIAFCDNGYDSTANLKQLLEKSRHGSDDEIRQAIKELEVLANKGLGLAQLELGKAYFSGRSNLVAEDRAEAFYWFDLAGKQKIPEAFYYLGVFYQGGNVIGVNVVEEDENKAISFFKLAADSGLTQAKLALGYIYATSKQTKHVPSEAFKYLSSAADDGDMDAKLTVAFMYIDGIGTAKDLLKGSRLLRQVASSAKNEYDINWIESHAAKFSLQFLNGYTRTSSNEELLNALSALNGIQSLFGSSTAASAKEAAESFLLNRGEKNSIIMALATSRGGITPITKKSGGDTKPPAVHGEQNNQKVTKTGSGVLVSNSGSILTNYHVVSNCSSVLVDGNNANLVASDPNNDLALLSTTLKDSAATVRKLKLKLGEEVVVAGFPFQSVLNNGINITNGIVSSLSGINNDTRLIQVSAPVNPGNSGGALLDMHGDLVGLVSSTLKPISDRSPQNINFAISIHVIDSFLTNNNIQTSANGRPRQAKIEDVAKMATKFTKFIGCVN